MVKAMSKVFLQMPKIDTFYLEAISKMQITFKDKARADEKAESRLRRDEQYILRRFATP
jgi:hypothetical protein